MRSSGGRIRAADAVAAAGALSSVRLQGQLNNSPRVMGWLFDDEERGGWEGRMTGKTREERGGEERAGEERGGEERGEERRREEERGGEGRRGEERGGQGRTGEERRESRVKHVEDDVAGMMH